MAANTLDQPRVAQSPVLLTAWSTIVGAAMTFALGLPLAAFEAAEPSPWWVPVLNAVSHLLLLVGVVGLVRSGAAGRGGLAASGLGLTMLGLAMSIVAEFGRLIVKSEIYALYFISSLAMMLGLILAGVAMVRGGRWTGWRSMVKRRQPWCAAGAGPAGGASPCSPAASTSRWCCGLRSRCRAFCRSTRSWAGASAGC